MYYHRIYQSKVWKAMGWVRETSMVVACVVSLLSAVSCSDDYKLDDEGHYPPGYGLTLYGALQNPSSVGLEGSFTTYQRLIEDLGYAQTMDGQASSTIFPANDDAFARFFQGNSWGVTSYGQLSLTQKRILLYSSMLDNPMLVEMLGNVPNGESSYIRGQAIKHATHISSTDTITHYYMGAAVLPKTKYWEGHLQSGINLVSDATGHQMVHFTHEQMTGNQITTTGSPSDFEVLTGEAYNESERPAYVFRDKIIMKDISCKNGYIHQVQDVVVDPGNIAQVLRDHSDTKIFSAMIDRFSAPYYNSGLTTVYNNNARLLGKASIDSIFERRYFSRFSQGAVLSTAPDGEVIASDAMLPFDPGWNAYYVNQAGSNRSSEIACMFVPTDQALVNYFTTEEGGGKFIIDQFCGKENNTASQLADNLMKVPANIVCAFLANLMKSSFSASVPSKFDFVLDDAGNPMGLSLDYIHKTAEGKYDVRIANNGVIYVMDEVIAPATYRSVSAPALFNQDMKVMNWLIQDKSYLGQNFYAYLLAMDANYALFIPDDRAFGAYYIDPAHFNRSGRTPRVLKFWYDATATPSLRCTAYPYNRVTGAVDTSDSTTVGLSSVRTQLIDMLNYHTVVLDNSEDFGQRTYYKTKHGGAICYDRVQGTVSSGATYDSTLPVAKISIEQARKPNTGSQSGNNGVTYRTDRVIAPPMNSVYRTLQEQGMTKFLDYCNATSSTTAREVMNALGLSGSQQRRYQVFVNNNGMDYNVSYFNTYNYTVYAPGNDAMDYALAHGLPTWQQIADTIRAAKQLPEGTEAYTGKMAKAEAMMKVIDNFIRYHFQDNAIFVDNTVGNSEYETAAIDGLSRHIRIRVSSSADGTLTLTDALGHSQTLRNDEAKINLMARDYEFTNANAIETSSFAVIHELGRPLNYGSDALDF